MLIVTDIFIGTPSYLYDQMATIFPPTVPLLHTSAIYTDAKLDKNIGNYKEWYW